MPRAYEMMKGESLEPFYSALTNEATKENYAVRLRQFLELAQLEPDEFVNLARKKPESAEKAITDYIEKRKKDGISSASIATTRDALKHLLTMNRIKKIDWDIINKRIPPARHHSNDRPPTMQEVRALLMHADLKIRCVILLLVSSGMRIGALDYLNWGDLEEIKQGSMTMAKLKIYAGEPEEYETLIAPEAYEALLEYRKLREMAGEVIDRESPLIVNDFNKRTGLGRGVKLGRSKSKVIRNTIGRLWKQSFERSSSQRKIVKSSGKSLRYEFKQVHGFRKLYKSTCERYMKSLYVEILMGHSTGVTNSYMKPTTKELVEEYNKAVPSLTILAPKPTATQDEIMARVNRQTLLAFEYADAEIEKLGDLSTKTPEEIQGLIKEKKGQVLGLNGKGRQKVVPMGDVKNYIEQGWEFVQSLPTNEAVIGLPIRPS
jgi:integrase